MGHFTHITGRRWTKKDLLLALGLAALVAGFFILVMLIGLMHAIDGVVAGLREAGPGVFFVAMGVLPAGGFPLLAFTLVAGPVLGSAWVVGWSLLAMVVRLTPGTPLWVQSYLLGLMRVPLAPYLIVSTLVMAGSIVALVCGGEAIAQGNGRLAFAAVCVLVISVALLQLLCRRTARWRAAAALNLSPPEPIPVK